LAGAVIGAVGLLIGIVVVIFAIPVSSHLRRLQTRMYGDRVGSMQTPNMVRFGAVLVGALGFAMIVLGILGLFGTSNAVT
jgi:hypothetical protein